MVKSFSIDEKTRNKMVSYYQDYSISPPQYASHAFKLPNFNIIIYNSLKVVFNGKFTEKDFEKWIANLPYFKGNVIGSDEVGTGDFFGPIVVVSAYVSEDDVLRLKQHNIMDSKQMSDEKILLLAKELIKFISYKLVICSNVKYNELYEKGYNIKSILAIMHNKAIKEHQRTCEVIIDQFVSKAVFEKYTNEKNNYTFVTKGESKSIAVATASIIARACFINEMKKLELEINSLTSNNYQIKYGAGSESDKVAKQIYQEIGLKNIKKYVKANFKNLEKIKGE